MMLFCSHSSSPLLPFSLPLPLPLLLLNKGGGHGGEFRSRGFKQLMVDRVALLSVLLQSGRRVLVCDIDAVWHANPLPFLHAQPPRGDGGPVAAMVAQLDGSKHICGE